jgi:Glycosyl transferase family 2
MISVCMATYNGARWVIPQIESILRQLGPADELVIVDDASTDNTVAVVSALNDPRIRIVGNPTNVGIDRTFERAIGLATGDYIFLSDQDDVWYPVKVERTIAVFEAEPATTLVLSDAEIIDAAGHPRGETYFGDRGRFVPGVVANILKSKFLGCAIAFRAALRDKILPFPHPIPGHDMWIGVINEMYGRTHFIAEPLIGYRRHDTNASPFRSQNLQKMLLWRWQLIRGLADHMLKRLHA